MVLDKSQINVQKVLQRLFIYLFIENAING